MVSLIGSTTGLATVDKYLFPHGPVPDDMSIYDVFKNNQYDPCEVTVLDVAVYMSEKSRRTGETLIFAEGSTAIS